MNKDLILREKLALQRTHLANQTACLKDISFNSLIQFNDVFRMLISV